MNDDDTFMDHFFARCALARIKRNVLQADAAKELGVDADLYKHYENRTPIPHKLIPTFCRVFQCPIDWLFTGHGIGPATTKQVADFVAQKKLKRLATKSGGVVRALKIKKSLAR